MEKCHGLMGKLLGHSFRIAVTKGAPSIKINEASCSAATILRLIDESRPETYHGVYCKRCGKVING